MFQTNVNIEQLWDIANIIFPYPSIKKTQKSMILSLLSSQKPILISTETGVGKTAALLTALLTIKKSEEKIIIFVRTKAQINVYLRELSKIFQKIMNNWNLLEEHFENFPIMMPMLGKNELCLKARKDYPGELYTHICRLTKCPLKAKTQRIGKKQLILTISKLIRSFPQILSADDLYSCFNKEEYCPYFLSYLLMQKADIIIATYPFLENSTLNTRLLYSVSVPLHKTLIAIDEAHNLYRPLNQEIQRNILERAVKEYPNGIYSDLFKKLDQKQIFEVNYSEDLLQVLGEDLLKHLQFQIRNEKLPAIHAYLCYHFILSAKAKKVISDGKKLSIVNIMPSDMLKKVHYAQRLTFMSGSFEPIKSYLRLFQIPACKTLRVFPQKEEAKSKYLVLCNQLYNAKYENRDEKYFSIVAKGISELFKSIPGHTLVFTPSYAYINEIIETGLLKPDIVETKGQDITTLQTILTNVESKKLILCVTGGKIAEGIEFTHQGRSLIKGIIATALPFPPPSEESNLVYNELSNQFGEKLAREFSIVIPTIQRLSQSFGRAIRNKGDAAVHILLDPRGTRFSREFHFERHQSIERMIQAIEKFFEEKNPDIYA